MKIEILVTAVKYYGENAEEQKMLTLQMAKEEPAELLSAPTLRDWLRNELEVMLTSQPSATNDTVTIARAISDKVADARDAVLDKLVPIFRNDREQAISFIMDIENMKPMDITSLVNQLVKEKKILKSLSHRSLWTVLHNAGLYRCSESNWNKQVN